MTKFIFSGPLRYRWRSFWVLLASGLRAWWRQRMGRASVASWSQAFEAGNLFYRAQFNHALSMSEIAEGRRYFDSLYGVLTTPDVRVIANQEGAPRGEWLVPQTLRSDTTVLYFHGGGYSFYAAVSKHFVAALSHILGLRLFAPDYRLTPEHPHPAQLEDAIAAYRHLLSEGISPRKLVVAGDSAGGHLALMLLAQLNAIGLPQPSLCVALSPWTDVGRRGASQFGNDRYDMVQGYMTLLFGRWLKGTSGYSDEELSPLGKNYEDVAPIYLQAGGKEILVDMIRDFARVVRDQGARVRLEVWPDMTHEFHAYGYALPESREALLRIEEAIAWARGGLGECVFPVSVNTEIDSLKDQPGSHKTGKRPAEVMT